MKRVLQFSGGKDSLALLYLMQGEWNDLLVMWCNTGAAYPSTRDLMREVQSTVPYFIEVRGNQPEFVERIGYPADIVPAAATKLGRLVENTHGDIFVPAFECCYANIWRPMDEACRALGVTDVYRGQKNSDGRKAPIRNGHSENGITYWFPLAEWSDADVRDYLGKRLPQSYRDGERTSRDCWSCTAYLDENVERINALPGEQRMLVRGKLDSLLACVNVEAAVIERCLSKGD